MGAQHTECDTNAFNCYIVFVFLIVKQTIDFVFICFLICKTNVLQHNTSVFNRTHLFRFISIENQCDVAQQQKHLYKTNKPNQTIVFAITKPNINKQQQH